MVGAHFDDASFARAERRHRAPEATAGLIEADLFYACHPHKGVSGVRSGVFEGRCVLFWAHKMRRSNSIHARVEQSVDYGNQWGVAHGFEYRDRKMPKLTNTLPIESGANAPQ